MCFKIDSLSLHNLKDKATVLQPSSDTENALYWPAASAHCVLYRMFIVYPVLFPKSYRSAVDHYSNGLAVNPVIHL